jgi:predicted transcriptional regulator
VKTRGGARPGAGRKPLPPHLRRAVVRLDVRVSPAVAAKLDELSDRLGASQAEVIAAALDALEATVQEAGAASAASGATRG